MIIATPDSIRPFGNVSLDLQPIVIVEVRGHKVSQIQWTDKTTKQQNRMEKYLVAGEFADGTQIHLAQIGRDFTGQMGFERGQRYIFAIKHFEHEKDALLASFIDAMPYNGTLPLVPAKPAPVAGK